MRLLVLLNMSASSCSHAQQQEVVNAELPKGKRTFNNSTALSADSSEKETRPRAVPQRATAIC
jgi:hypothetical protein